MELRVPRSEDVLGGADLVPEPPVETSMKRLAGAVRQLLRTAGQAYPAWLRRRYQRDLAEALRALRSLAAQKRRLYRRIRREVAALARGTGAAGGAVARRRRGAVRCRRRRRVSRRVRRA